MISDRLYKDDDAQAAMNFVWANIGNLMTPSVLPAAVRCVSYVANHASKRWAPDPDGEILPVMTTAETAEFDEKAKQLCQHFEINVGEDVEGVVGAAGGGLIANALLLLLKKLLEELLKNQS